MRKLLFLFPILIILSCSSNDEPFVEKPIGSDAPFFVPYINLRVDTNRINKYMEGWEVEYKVNAPEWEGGFYFMKVFRKNSVYVDYFVLDFILQYARVYYIDNDKKLMAEWLPYLKEHYGKPFKLDDEGWGWEELKNYYVEIRYIKNAWWEDVENNITYLKISWSPKYEE